MKLKKKNPIIIPDLTKISTIARLSFPEKGVIICAFNKSDITRKIPAKMNAFKEDRNKVAFKRFISSSLVLFSIAFF